MNIEKQAIKIDNSSLYKGLFKICRPFNSTLAGLATIIGILISIGLPDVPKYFTEMIIAAIVTALIAAGGYVINDYYDSEIDRINQPHRPIPSNQVSETQAFIFAIILFVIGFIFSFFLAFVENNNLTTILITPILALAGIICLYFYAYYFKRTPAIGNLVITILVCIPFIYGGTVTNHYNQSIYPILVASTLMLGREIIKDVEDVEGDKLGSSKDQKQITTLPMIFGIKKTALIGKSILVVFLIFSPVAFLMTDITIYQSWALLICIGIADIMVIYSIYNLRGSEDEIIKKATKSKRLLKSTIAVGILGLLLASITPFTQLPKF